MAKYKVCGAPHRACGPSTTVIPVDSRITRAESAVGTLKNYEVPAGRRGEYTAVVQLDDEAVKRLQAAGVEPKEIDLKKAAKKAPAKSRAASNKSRTASNKSRSASKPAAAPAPAKPAETAPAGGDNE